MQRLSLFLPALVLCATITFAQGIQFDKGSSWNDILAKAAQEDKIIFVDAYATWCGPCKMMDAKVFTDKKVGEYFNANFVNAKIDMEKGEGPQLARQYGVRAYPTFLFIDKDGELVHMGLGYQPAEQFLQLGAAASDGEGIGTLEQRYEAGERDPQFLLKYMDALNSTMQTEKLSGIAAAYLATQEDWSTDQNLELIFGGLGGPGTELTNYVLDNPQPFFKKFGQSATINELQRALLPVFSQGMTKIDIEAMRKKYTEFAPSMAEQLGDHFAMLYHLRSQDNPAFAKAAVHYMDTYGSDDANELNTVAWAFYQRIDAKKDLAKAIGWAKRSVELDRGYYNLDTLAWLYQKAGKEAEAVKTALAAIELAKENGEDYSGTEKILKGDR
jgi:thioredoxin-related protein